ncbi:hypothetical protein [Polynucleobacter sp.]|uniref:hypothetical protein n=1 Tax=Polynucleobacter sp. TaxID=2029855 RepID=UPI0033401E83
MGKKNENWGGKRLNAGIPRIEGGRRVLVTLKPEHIELATLLGNGNMASGVRKALELVPNGTKRSKS